MIEIQITPLAKARLWIDPMMPGHVSSGTIARKVAASPTCAVRLNRLTIEAYVPRGGRVEYGLLGFHFEPNGNNMLRISVPYTETDGVPWHNSIAARVDDVRLGLPHEFARPVIDTVAEFAADGFPTGNLTMVEAAHGLLGSSELFFQRIAVCALSLMIDDYDLEPQSLASFLMAKIINT